MQLIALALLVAGPEDVQLEKDVMAAAAAFWIGCDF